MLFTNWGLILSSSKIRDWWNGPEENSFQKTDSPVIFLQVYVFVLFSSQFIYFHIAGSSISLIPTSETIPNKAYDFSLNGPVSVNFDKLLILVPHDTNPQENTNQV